MEIWPPKVQPEGTISFDAFAHSLSNDFDALLRNAWTRWCATATSPAQAIPMPPLRSAPKWMSSDAKFIDHLYALRRFRENLFAKDLFADPSWDILLDLYRARLNNQAISVSSACIGAAAPPTTALRHIRNLEGAGLLKRTPDRFDQRRFYLALTEKAAEAMDQWIVRAMTGIKGRSSEPTVFS